MQNSGHPSVSNVAREARALAQSLKESVKKNEALDKEAELQRKNLRKQYLKLLLLYPNSKEAKDNETHIWMQTSYQFISVYKQRLAILDKKLFSSQPQAGKNAARQDPGGGGHVEYRKILSRFRQFLAEEEKFYVQLLVRFESQFDLTETRPALVRAEIISPEQGDALPTDSGRSLFPEQVEMTTMTTRERENRLATFTKVLVCLGDIARYREQYNDGGGRPRAGHEEGQPRRAARGGRKGGHEAVARPRNYSRARVIYEQARLLLPNDGNASHQLAILCSYQKDSFGSLFHYYRALCVRLPYDTASENLNTVLKKALDQYRASKGVRDADDTQMVQKIRNDHFLESVVVLHGLWYLDSDERATRASKHAQNIVAKFKSLIAEPALPTNLVSEVVIVAVSALWKMRMIRDQHIRASRKVVEPLVAMHILVISRALFDTARLQLAEKIEDIQDKGDLAQQITAALRRILPAIRIISKWLRSNISYIDAAGSTSLSPDSFGESIKAFWDAYTAFLTSLSETFPLSKLPVLKGPLEEDVDLTGFSPIKKEMLIQPAATDNGLAPGQDEVHPNEEYLMRISDLLRDAEQNVTHENVPISVIDGKFVYSARQSTPVQVANTLIPDAIHSDEVLPSVRDNEDEDDNTTEISHDDVVRDAFNEALRDDPQSTVDYNDEEDDQIVWSPPKSHYTPLQNPIQTLQASPPTLPPVQQPSVSTPTFVPPPSIPSTGTTAQDLLNNVLRISRPKSEHSLYSHQRVPSSTPQASLLFGSGSFNAPTKSIWSDNNSPVGPTIAAPPTIPQYGSLAPGHERARTQSQSFSRSQPWASQAPTNTQDPIYPSTGNISGALPVGHLGFSQLAGHPDLALSGSQDFFHVAPAPAQVFYDSQFPQPPMPPTHNHQESHMHGYGSQSADPFLHYNSQRNNGFAGVTPSVPSINQSIWNT